MKAIYAHGLLLMAVLFLVSCEKINQQDIPLNTPEVIVIQSLMTDKPGRQEVKITQVMSSPTGASSPVRNALVFLSSTDTVIVFQEDSLNAGVYYAMLSLEMKKNYTLQVINNQQVYAAKASGEPGMVFNPPVFEKSDSNDLWYPAYIAPPFMPDHPAMYELLANWSMLPEFQGWPAEKCTARMLFFTLPSIDVTQLLPPPVLNQGFPEGTLITVRRYSMDLNYAAYWREVLLETRWAAGLFALESANVPTNFSGGARGWFAICGVTELSLVLGQ
ncbi:MAG: hypothetical protein ACP5O2_09530 [Bacteroidales bacterium]